MQYHTVLELELDDWLDPSLSRAYKYPLCATPDLTQELRLSMDFTEANDEFRQTSLLPLWTPVMVQGNICLMQRETNDLACSVIK